MVGILLPPSIPGALVNYAAMLAGKIPVNLNYTLSDEALASCTAQCNIQTVISTKLLLDRIPLKIPCKTILLEHAAANSRFGEKMAALALWFCPGWLIERAVAQRPANITRRLATVIFSSGSTGEPKGVMLTHYNIAANIEQALQVFMFERRDFMLGILPFFHSFGFTDTLWLPAQIGVGVIFHPSPLDTDAIGELVRDYRVTFLISTPTFLQHYLRRCSPEDFASLRYVIVGAEKLPASLAEAFEKRFGIAPLEGYGVTECSPVIAVNTRDFSGPGVRQSGRKSGSVGRPLPAISVRIVDPDTSAPVAARNARHASRPRAQRDAGLSRPAGENGGSAARRLVRHRRYRLAGRRRLSHHHRPPEPLQQNRRRNGAAPQSRRRAPASLRRFRAELCRYRRAGRKERRAPGGAAHAFARATRRDPREALRDCACRIFGRHARTSSFMSTSCRALARASSTCAKFARSPSNFPWSIGNSLPAVIICC